MFSMLFILVLPVVGFSCPLSSDSPCHCAIKNDSSSYIQCSSLGLTKVPAFVHSFTYDELILSNNFITAIKNDSFDNLRVKKLTIKNNPIQSVAERAFNALLNQLEEIELDVLKSVTRLPSSLQCAPKLKSVVLSGFNLNNKIQFCAEMTRLRTVSLNNCSLESLRDIFKINDIVSLSASDNNLKEIPPLPNVSHLNLSGNAIGKTEFTTRMYLELPVRLKTLDLSRNKMKEWIIPPLPYLTELIINENNLRVLKAPMPKYPLLKTLIIRSNQLNTIQQSAFQYFDSLQYLDVSSNVLKSFEPILNNLVQLSLSDNKLTSTPENIPASLKYIDLSNNHICSVSASSVSQLARLQKFRLERNPLFCDCNLRWLQIEITQRDLTDALKCNAPPNFADKSIKNVGTLPCVPDVPVCVRLIHGPHLEVALNETTTIKKSGSHKSLDLNEINVHYLPSPRQILVIWESSNTNVEHFRVSFQTKSSKSTQLSTLLPSSARQFALHGAHPDTVYTVCVIAFSQSFGQTRHCRDVITAETQKVKSHESNFDQKIIIFAATLVGTVLVVTSIALLLCISRREKEVKSIIPVYSPPHYCCYDCSHSSDNSSCTMNNSLNRHVYQEIKENFVIPSSI